MRFDLSWQGRIFEEGRPWFPVEVPGNIQYDWAVSEGFADRIMIGTEARRFETVEDVFWLYRTALPAVSLKPGERLDFVAEGIDYRFDILLDGEKLLSHEGMFTPVRIDLTDRVHEGSVLEVLIYPHPKLAGMAADRSQASQSCKPPSVYGWDWNPRLLISGIWQPAYLETRGPGFIRSCEPFYTLDASRTKAWVRFETDAGKPVTYTLKDREGNTVYEGRSAEFAVENVRLWWCNGQGEPYLYTWEARTCDSVATGRIGFRTVRLVMNEGAETEPDGFPKSRYNAPVTVELNGRRIFAKGSNWVNPELFFGRITEKRYREELIAARDANMNILRLWGGSGIKKAAFYDACDELGLLVWQEFMLACNNYEGTPEYLQILEQEASYIIRTLRRRPCVAIWCGGNELFNNWSNMTDQSLALRLLNKLCYDLDPERPFLMTSPLIGMMHGCYVFDDGEQQVYSMFQNAHGTAYSEFGVPAAPPAATLRKIIPPEEIFPVEKTESWLYHHGFRAWSEERWLCLDVIRKYFGEPDSLEELVDDTNWLQVEGYKAIFEEARRQWPYCSMAINWCFNEPWITAANNSLLAYPAEKRPAYFAVTDSLRPRLFSARIPKFDWRAGETFTAELWLLNDRPEPVEADLRAVLELDGREVASEEWNASAEVNRNAKGPTLTCVLPRAVSHEMKLRLTGENPSLNTEYTLLFYPEELNE